MVPPKESQKKKSFLRSLLHSSLLFPSFFFCGFLASFASVSVAAATLPDGHEWGVLRQYVPRYPPGCVRQYPPDDSRSEDLRVALHHRCFGQWPPKFTLPYRPHPDSNDLAVDHPKFVKYMEDLERWVRIEVTDPQARSIYPWDWFSTLASMRVIDRLTEKGWSTGSIADTPLHSDIQKWFHSQFDQEKWDQPQALMPVEPHEEASAFNILKKKKSLYKPLPHDLRQRLTDELLPKVAKWAGYEPHEIVPTLMYGPRTYLHNATLKAHVDHPDTHVISIVYMLDVDYRKPGSEETVTWPMEATPDWTGEDVEIDLKPGDIFYYESGKLFHGRSTNFLGRWSSHIFIHFQPKNWDLTRGDIPYAIPPDWREIMERRPEDTYTRLRDGILRDEL